MPAMAIHTNTEAEVAIIGLGPVGATVAALLAAQGVRSVALERAPAPSALPRAVALDDESLRILQRARLAGTGAPELLVGPGVALRGRADRLLLALPAPPRRFGHPTLAFVHQPDLEAALRRRLAAEPLVHMRLGARVTAVTEHGDGVTVRVAGEAPVRVAYVLGCDGATGVTRHTLGVTLRGWSSPRRWLVVDGRRGLAPRDPQPFTFHADPRRPSVDGPLPAGRHRWEFMLQPDEDPHAMISPRRVGELLRDAGAGSAVSIERAAVYTFHARVAAHWRRGRVVLLGDAAHLSPPFAGQGLGAGLRDADNLAWKLAAVLRGGAHDALLESYARERRAHVRQMNALALGLGGAVQTRSATLAAVRDVTVAGLARIPRAAGWARRGGWKPPPRHRRGIVAPGRGDRADSLHGRLVPQPLVRDGAGRVALLDDLLGTGFALLGLDVPVDVPAPPAGLDFAVLRLRRDGTCAGEREASELDDALRLWWPLAAHRVLILRPDRFVFAASEAGGVPTALHMLARALGLGRAPVRTREAS